MDDLISRLSRLDSCAVSDALDKLGLKGAVTGIRRFSSERRIAGRVLTVKLDRAEGRTNTRHLCTAAIEAASPGDIIVVEQHTGLDAASWGGNLSIGAQVRGVAGVIVEGPVRDIDDSRKLDFPVFARDHTARTARGRIVEVATGEPMRAGETCRRRHGFAAATTRWRTAARRCSSRRLEDRAGAGRRPRPSSRAKRPWPRRCAKASRSAR